MATPLFFGPPGHPLYGFHHVPRGLPTSAVLLCPPWGHEYQYAHRTLAALAGRLQERGAHVLRFDYSGTGDSWGDSTEARLERWIDDVGHAVEELRMTSGVQMVDVVGLRLGAYLAARATTRTHGVRTLLLWDPVTDGPTWIGEMGAPETFGPGLAELGNLLVTERFVEEVRSLRPEDLDRADAYETIHLLTQENHDHPEPPALRSIRTERIPQPAPWLEDASIWSGPVPAEAVKRIVEWLT